MSNQLDSNQLGSEQREEREVWQARQARQARQAWQARQRVYRLEIALLGIEIQLLHDSIDDNELNPEDEYTTRAKIASLKTRVQARLAGGQA